MAAKINWTLRSRDDLQSIYNYIASDSPYYAEREMERIIAATFILENNPKAGRIVPEINKEEIREVFYGNYRIIYHLFSEVEIDVLTVHHGAMRLRLG